MPYAWVWERCCLAQSCPALRFHPLLQLAGLVVLAQRPQVSGEVAGRGEGVGMVVA